MCAWRPSSSQGCDSGSLLAQTGPPGPGAGWGDDPPAISALVAFSRTESDLRVAVNRYLLDKSAIERRFEVPYSPARHQRLRTFYQGWQRRLAESDFDGLNAEGKIDYVMLRHRVEYDLEALDAERGALDADGAAGAVRRAASPPAGGSLRSASASTRVPPPPHCMPSRGRSPV